MQVYLNVIDDLGRRLYSGKITWLREYIQNAIDSGAKEIKISIKGSDLEITDDGSGMNESNLKDDIYSIGGSKKNKDQIGELGIGIYAGVGICEKIVIHTKQNNGQPFEAIFDSNLYKKLIEENPAISYEEGIKQIYSHKTVSDNVFNNKKSFTMISFYNIDSENLKLLKNEIGNFIKENINIPISDEFTFKKDVIKFLGKTYNPIKINLNIEGNSKQIEKFDDLEAEFYDKPLFYTIKNNNEDIAKIWAYYSKNSESFSKASILVKFKGMTVGDKKTVSEKFEARYSPRFIGEIIILDCNLQINTERNWFIYSKGLEEIKKEIKNRLYKLFGIADFDSSYGIGLKKKKDKVKKIEDGIKKERNSKNQGIVEELNKEKDKILQAIERKEEQAKRFSETLKNKKEQESFLKIQILENNKYYINDHNVKNKNKQDAKERKSPFPEIIKTFITEKIIDPRFTEHIKGKNMKDTTNNIFTIIENAIRNKLEIDENKKIEFDELISNFLNNYELNFDNNSVDKKELGKINGNFKSFLMFTHKIFRNPSAHTLMSDKNTDRNILQVLLIGDFILQFIESYAKK